MQLSAALLSLVVLVFPPPSAAADGGPPSALASGFASSCTNPHLVNSHQTLAATCGGRAATIPLNQCLANFDGSLACQSGGGALNTCSGCRMDNPATPTTVTCICRRTRGGTFIAVIDLNSCVGVNNGVLFC